MSNVRIVLVGDSAVGLKYTGVAAHKARALRALPHATRKTHWVPLGEVTLRIELDDLAGDVVYIDATVSCPPTQYAGFVDTWAPDSAYLKGKPKRVEELQNLDEQRVARMQLVGNTDPDKIRLLPETGLPSEEWEELPADPVMSGMRLAEPVNNEYPKVKVDMPVLEQEWRKFFDEHKPSKYSGLMRRVLQATFALDDWADRLTYVVGEGENRRREFLLNYKWGDSWGVVLAPGKDGSHGSHYFLIWVTTGEVFWVPATFCVTEAELDGQTVFVPVIGGIQRTEAVSLGTISYVGAAQHETIGWAFSYTEPKAAAVLYDVREPAAPMLYTQLATLEFAISEVPDTASLSTDAACRLWHALGKAGGFVHGLATGVSGAVCVDSLYNLFRRGPAATESIKAPVGTFYRLDGVREVVEFTFEQLPESVEVRSPTGYTAYAMRIISPYDYTAIGADATAKLDQGVGVITYGALNRWEIAGRTYSLPRTTHEVTDTRQTYTLFADDLIGAWARGSTFNHPRWVRVAGHDWYWYAQRVAVTVYSAGTDVRQDTRTTSAALPLPGDREAWLIAATIVRGAVDSARSTGWKLFNHHREEPYGPEQWSSGFFSANATFPALAPRAAFPWDIPPPSAEGYYEGQFMSYSGYDITALVNSGQMPANAVPPTGTFARSGDYSDELAVLTAHGVRRYSGRTDPVLLSTALRYHSAEDPDDQWSPKYSGSALQGVFAMGNGLASTVVRMGNKEYNVEHAVFGWLGVV